MLFDDDHNFVRFAFLEALHSCDSLLERIFLFVGLVHLLNIEYYTNHIS